MRDSSILSFAYNAQQTIPVIAAFDSEGHIRPLYVRITGDAYKIVSYWEKQCHAGIIEFNCKVADKEYLKPLLLTYYSREKIWTIPG